MGTSLRWRRTLAMSLALAAVAMAQEHVDPGGVDERSSWDVDVLPLEMWSGPPESSEFAKPCAVEMLWMREGTAVFVRHGKGMACLEGDRPEPRVLDWPTSKGHAVSSSGHLVLVRPDGVHWRDPADDADFAHSPAELDEYAWQVFCDGGRVLLYRDWSRKWFEIESPGAVVRQVSSEHSALWVAHTGSSLVCCEAEGPRRRLAVDPPGVLRHAAGPRSILEGLRIERAEKVFGPIRNRGEALLWRFDERAVIARKKIDAGGGASESGIEQFVALARLDSTGLIGLVDRDHVVAVDGDRVELYQVEPGRPKCIGFWRCEGSVLAMRAHPVQDRMLIAYARDGRVRVRLVEWR